MKKTPKVTYRHGVHRLVYKHNLIRVIGRGLSVTCHVRPVACVSCSSLYCPFARGWFPFVGQLPF